MTRQQLALFFLLPCITFSNPVPRSTNRTIDDQLGDSVNGNLPVYSPSLGWAIGQDCTPCGAKLDPTKAFSGTWHDATRGPGDVLPRTVEVQFTGTAVYVYNALANNLGFPTTTNVSFSLDGVPVGSFLHVSRADPGYDYNVLVYANESLTNKAHSLVMANLGGAFYPSLILFDYVVYTSTELDRTSQPSSTTFISETQSRLISQVQTVSSSSATPTDAPYPASDPLNSPGVIAGGTVAAISLVIVLALVALLLRRRYQRVGKNQERVGDRTLRGGSDHHKEPLRPLPAITVVASSSELPASTVRPQRGTLLSQTQTENPPPSYSSTGKLQHAKLADLIAVLRGPTVSGGAVTPPPAYELSQS